MSTSELPQNASERPVLVIGAAGLDMVGTMQTQQRVEGSNAAHIRVSFGGVARNVAENLARLGQPVMLMTAVGDDMLGRQLLTHTAACGVDVSASVQLAGQPTASYLAVYSVEDKPEMALDDMRVLGAFTPSVLRAHKTHFEAASLVFIDGNLSAAAIKTVFSMARRAGVPVCADTTSAALAPKFAPYLDSLFLLTANRREASVINPETPEITGRFTAMQAVRQLVNRGVEVALVPLAHFGVCYATSEGSGHVPAVRTHITDPTGAGDALTATVLFGLCNQIPIDEAVRLGVTAASLILRYPGTVLPGLSLERLYAELAS